jgi:hypothetical protein
LKLHFRQGEYLLRAPGRLVPERQKSPDLALDINAGKLNESWVENFLISSAAKVASAPFGKNDELLFSWTEVSFPNNGPKIPVIMNQEITTNIAMAYGFLFFWALWIDTIISAFQTGG